MSKEALKTADGKVSPFGVSVTSEGVNFAVFSKGATDVTLCLFESSSREAIAEIPLDPKIHRTGDVWHILVTGLPDQFLYAYRTAKKKGRLFANYYCENNLILDPYAKAVESRKNWGNCEDAYHPLGKAFPEDSYDWEGDRPLKLPLKDLVIYELHVRGFTCHDSSNVSASGTFQGVIEKIPFLRDLGINAVKLMPIHEFNECEYARYNPFSGQRLFNYWGYSTVNYFSPMQRYSASDPVAEFRGLVKELHKNGIEVILDVVFNHTAEGNIMGPTYSFKGLDPGVYYILDKKQHHMNFTGCGNTVNCNHPVVRQLIRECLNYWVTEMHVDGFRFDLAAIMTRGMQGEPLENPPLIETLSQDPVLAGTKLIAEPWDCGGLYQLGNFYPKQERWSEWNDRYRDTIRKFIKGDKGAKRDFARRICGSEDIFPHRSPCSSLNFITAHDGFTLRDLVTYNEKHNSANGEDNRDGNNANYSWNCGYEGPTSKEEVLQLREKQMRNFHLALMTSQGVPMLLMGDEYGHTREGNNNVWCQDNTLNWYLWSELEKNTPFFRYYKGLIHLRRRHELFRLGRFLTDNEIEWHGTAVNDPDWDGDTQTLAYLLKNETTAFYLAFNMHHQPLTLILPRPPVGQHWSTIVNTSQPSPDDFYEEEQAPIYKNPDIELNSHTAILLKNKEGE